MFFERYSRRNSVKEFICKANDTYLYSQLHPWTGLQSKAHRSTVEFLERNYPRAVPCRSPRKLMDLALTSAGPGLILEFGVFKGDSLRYIAHKMPHHEVWGFDCFEGLPENWVHPKGTFDVAGKLPKVPKNVSLLKGRFEETLPAWIQTVEQPISLVHIDCDLRSSTETIFDHIADQLRPGAVLVFDDYFNFPGWEDDGHAVLEKYQQRLGWNLTCIGYGYKELALILAHDGSLN